MTPVQIRQNIIRRERRFKLGIVLGILLLGTVILLAVPGLLTSFILAFVITYLFKPVVNYLERRRLPRTGAILILFLLTGFLIIGSSSFFIPRISEQAEALQTELPKYVTGLSALITKHTNKLTDILSHFSKVDVADHLTKWLESVTANALNYVPNWLSQILSTMILAPFFAFFMLRDGQNLTRKILSVVPNNLFESALNLVYQVNRQLGGFIRARLLEAVIVGLVVWVGLYTLGFPYATLLALFAGLTNLIPYVGPLIGAIPGIVVALVNQDSSTALLMVSSVYVLAQLVDMLLIIPLVVAKIVDLHPVTVVIVIVVGSQLMGVVGMIISVPVASIFKLTFTEVYNHIVDFRS